MYNPRWGHPFTIKTGQIPWFMDIFMIKTDGGVYIPPGILISMYDNGTLRTGIEPPYIP